MGTRVVVALVVVLGGATLGWLWLSGGESGAGFVSSPAGVVRPPALERPTGPVEAVPSPPGAALVTPLVEGLGDHAAADGTDPPFATDAAGHRLLTGRVVTPEGEPLEGARVHFLPSTGTLLDLGLPHGGPLIGSLERLPMAVTDAAGRFALSAPHVEPHTLTPRERMLAWSDKAPEIVAGAPDRTWRSLALPEHPDGPSNVGDIVLPPAATIVGRVLDASRNPLPGATVGTYPWTPADPDPRLQPGAGRAWEFWRTTSDERGRFVLDRVPPGRGRVALAHERHLSRDTVDMTLAAGDIRDLGIVTLEQGGVVAGVVQDEARRPLRGARVELIEHPATAAPARAAQRLRSLLLPGPLEARTDGAGAFRFAGLGGPDVNLVVSAPDHERKSVRWVDTGTTDLIVTLLRGAWLVVDVTDPAGARLPRAKVWAYRWSDRSTMGGQCPVLTGPDATALLAEHGRGDWDGTALVELPTGGDVALVVEAGGWAVRRMRVSPEELRPFERFTVVLAKGGQLAGRVTDAAGVPVPAVRVVAEPQDPSAALEGETVTDAVGRFELVGLSAGTWTLRASSEEHVDARPLAVPLGAGERHDDLELVLVDGGELLARVLAPDGSPAEGVRVSAWRESDGTSDDWHHARSNGDGEALFPALMPGPWRVRADPGGLLDVQVEVGRRADVDLQLRRPPRLTGVLRDGRSGQPVERAAVSVFRGSLADGERATVMGTATTDAQGRFEIEGKKPIEGTLVARVSGGGTSEPQHVVAGWDEHVRLDLWMPKGLVRGRVVDAATGQGLAGAAVHATRVDLSAIPDLGTAFEQTDVHGVFELRGLAAGTYALRWAQMERTPGSGVEVTLAPGEFHDDLVLPLGRGAVLRVRVTTPDGAWVRDGTELTILEADTGHYVDGGHTEAGQHTFTALPSGELQVVVAGALQVTARLEEGMTVDGTPITLADGTERTLDIVWDG